MVANLDSDFPPAVGSFALPRSVMLLSMDNAKLNAAVTQGVRECLGAPAPLEALNAYVIRLKDEGWHGHEVEQVRGACMAMLVGIYGRDIDEADGGGGDSTPEL